MGEVFSKILNCCWYREKENNIILQYDEIKQTQNNLEFEELKNSINYYIYRNAIRHDKGNDG